MKFQHLINVIGILLIAYLCIQLAQVRMKLDNALIMPKVESLYVGDGELPQ